MQPTAEPLHFPPGYGDPKRTLDWPAVRGRLEAARSYWLATTRPDGRPHVVPVDGIWLDDHWYFGGSAETVHERNLRADPRVAVHLEDAASAVIVEGRAERVTPAADLAARLAGAANAKYGYGATAEGYEAGIWALRPQRALAWSAFPTDATRFRFS
jgi:hypothetical protein